MLRSSAAINWNGLPPSLGIACRLPFGLGCHFHRNTQFVKHVVRGHGGKLELESNRPSTVFKMTLPNAIGRSYHGSPNTAERHDRYRLPASSKPQLSVYVNLSDEQVRSQIIAELSKIDSQIILKDQFAENQVIYTDDIEILRQTLPVGTHPIVQVARPDPVAAASKIRSYIASLA